jgi:hypothetical protein
MNKDDVIRMAQEAGLLRMGDGWTEPHRWGAPEVSKFAALAFAAGAAHERDACADEVIDCMRVDFMADSRNAGVINTALQEAVDAIRARGQA